MEEWGWWGGARRVLRRRFKERCTEVVKAEDGCGRASGRWKGVSRRRHDGGEVK